MAAEGWRSSPDPLRPSLSQKPKNSHLLSKKLGSLLSIHTVARAAALFKLQQCNLIFNICIEMPLTVTEWDDRLQRHIRTGKNGF